MTALYLVEPEPPSTKPERCRCFTRMSDDPKDPNYRLRVEEDLGVVEIVDEALTSSSATAQLTGLNGRVLMTLTEAAFVRDALCELLGTEGT